jgi:hypothetical protein
MTHHRAEGEQSAAAYQRRTHAPASDGGACAGSRPRPGRVSGVQP